MKVCVSQVDLEKLDNTEVVALCYEAFFCIAIFEYESAGDQTFAYSLYITEENFLICFL